MDNVTITFAFVAGLLSFLSPCVFPLLPAYVTNLTGSTFEANKLVVSRRVLIIRSLAFIIGFSLVFIAMGTTASAIGQVLSTYRDIFIKISGILVIIFGMQMAGMIKLKFLYYEKKVKVAVEKKNAYRSFLLGLSFGLGWTPCVSLALSSILLLASSSNTIFTGMFLLTIYSLGFGIPFLIISLLVTYSMNISKRINKYLGLLSIINGWILMTLGFLLFTGQLEKISAWLSRFTIFNF